MDRKDLNNLYKYDQIGGNTSYSPPDKEDNQVMKRNRFLQKENDKLKKQVEKLTAHNKKLQSMIDTNKF
jgi:hypothetical protein